jgi:hypothetical protein
MNLRQINIRATRYGTCADGDGYLGVGHGIVCFFQGEFHILRNRPSNKQTIGVSWRSDKLNAEPAEVVNNGGQDVGIGFTSVAAARRDLSQFQGPAKQLFHSLIKGFGQFHFLPAINQIGFSSRRKAILPAEFYRSAGTTFFALGTEQAFAKVDA